MLIRTATSDDAEAIRTIYNVEVETSTVTFDLRARTFAEQRRWIDKRSGVHTVVVATSDEGLVIGFGSLSPYKERPAYSTTVENSVYVHRQHQGIGVGPAILAELVARAEQHGFHSVVARIVGGHQASINLHARAGFTIVGHEREIGRKFNQWLDVVTMQLLFD